MRNIVVCLDGTWNSGFEEAKRRERDTKVLKPTNPLKLCRAVRPVRRKDGREQLTYYDIGVGALALYPGLANFLLRACDRMLGGAWGAGFERNVEDVLSFLALNCEPEDEVFLFGFSRGAAEARAVTQFLDWTGGLPIKTDAYFLPILFREFVRLHGAPRTEASERVRQIFAKIQIRPVIVKFLGVWDTVLALGSRFESTGETTSTAGRSFYAGKVPARCVMHARQALAIDERRYDFRPEIWHGPGTTESMEQRWFAGVHSNVGGAYGNDGLANIPLRWIVEEATTHGLDIDEDFLAFYKPWAGDTMYNSYTPRYFALDLMRAALRKGRRSLVSVPKAANAHIDPTVFTRMRTDPASLGRKRDQDSPRQILYRPRNVIEFLAAQPDRYIATLGTLPDDVQTQIAAIRGRSRGAPIQPVPEA